MTGEVAVEAELTIVNACSLEMLMMIEEDYKQDEKV
jgi:hypothetical protein